MRQRRSPAGVAAVGADTGLGLHANRSAKRFWGLKAPFIAGGPITVGNHRVGRQLGRVGRCPVCLQVPGRGTQHHMRGGETLADERRVRQRGDADGDVITLVHQIHHAVRQRHFQRHLRVLAAKHAPQRRQVQDAESDRRVDAQKPAGRAASRRDFCFRFIHPCQQLFAACVKHLAFLGE